MTERQPREQHPEGEPPRERWRPEPPVQPYASADVLKLIREVFDLVEYDNRFYVFAK
jgi:hypothetical protein